MKFEGEISFLQQLEMWECKIREREREKKKTAITFLRAVPHPHDFKGTPARF